MAGNRATAEWTGEQGLNLSGYASDRVDQLLEAARGTASFDDRAAIYGAFADEFRKDKPAIILFFPRYLYSVPSRMTGVQPALLASPADRFTGAESWALRTRRN